MSKCLMDRCHEELMESIDLLPSKRGDSISPLNTDAERCIEYGKMEPPGLFQQKPGTQFFFFRKTSSSA